MDYKKTRWRDITHELTGQVQFRPKIGYIPDIVPGGNIEGRITHTREYENTANEGSEID